MVAVTALTLAPSRAQRETTKDHLLGTWKVITLRATSSGKVSHPLCEQVAGYVSITPDRIWLLFLDSTRKPPAAPAPTDAEAVAMMKSHVAWTGRYLIAGQTPQGINQYLGDRNWPLSLNSLTPAGNRL